MFGASPLIIAVAIVVCSADVKNPALAEGIRLYDALDYAGALQSLTEALDKPSSKRDLARIHLYIGLIQHRFKLVKDAEASFTKALDYEPRVKMPKASTAGAKTLFKKIQKVKVPDDPGEARAEAEKKKKAKPKKRENDPDDGSGIEYISSSPVSGARTATAASSGAMNAGEAGRLPAGAIASASNAGGAPAARGGSAAASTSRPGAAELPGARATPPDRERESAAAATAASTVSSTVEGDDAGGPIAGWIAIGVGVAAVATGVTLGVLAADNGSDANSEPVASRAEQLHATAVQQRTLAFVSFGVSGAALGLAAVLFLTD